MCNFLRKHSYNLISGGWLRAVPDPSGEKFQRVNVAVLFAAEILKLVSCKTRRLRLRAATGISFVRLVSRHGNFGALCAQTAAKNDPRSSDIFIRRSLTTFALKLAIRASITSRALTLLAP